MELSPVLGLLAELTPGILLRPKVPLSPHSQVGKKAEAKDAGVNNYWSLSLNPGSDLGAKSQAPLAMHEIES